MRRTADHQEMRQMLISAEIKAVAEYGMEGVTSKRIAGFSELNEAYIFRYFLNMEDLRDKAFDKVLTDVLFEAASALKNSTSAMEESLQNRLEGYFHTNPDETLFLLRYYYSAAFTDTRFRECCRRLEERFGKKPDPLTVGRVILLTALHESVKLRGFIE